MLHQSWHLIESRAFVDLTSPDALLYLVQIIMFFSCIALDRAGQSRKRSKHGLFLYCRDRFIVFCSRPDYPVRGKARLFTHYKMNRFLKPPERLLYTSVNPF